MPTERGFKLRELLSLKGVTPAELEIVKFNFWMIENGLNQLGAVSPIAPGSGGGGGSEFDASVLIPYLYLPGRTPGQTIVGISSVTPVLTLGDIGTSAIGLLLKNKDIGSSLDYAVGHNLLGLRASGHAGALDLYFDKDTYGGNMALSVTLSSLFPGLRINVPYDADAPDGEIVVTIWGSAGSFANWNFYKSTTYMVVEHTGTVFDGEMVIANPSTKTLRVQRPLGGTFDIQRWQEGNTTVKSWIDKDGKYGLDIGKGLGKVYTSDANGLGSWQAPAAPSVHDHSTSLLGGIDLRPTGVFQHIQAAAGDGFLIRQGAGQIAADKLFRIENAATADLLFFDQTGPGGTARLVIQNGTLQLGEAISSVSTLAMYNAAGGLFNIFPQPTGGSTYNIQVPAQSGYVQVGPAPSPQGTTFAAGPTPSDPLVAVAIGPADSIYTSDGTNPVWRSTVLLDGTFATVSIDPEAVDYPFLVTAAGLKQLALDSNNTSIAVNALNIWPAGIGVNFSVNLLPAGLTAHRTQTLPNLDGTFLLNSSAIAQSQITGLVTALTNVAYLTAVQTFTAKQTFAAAALSMVIDPTSITQPVYFDDSGFRYFAWDVGTGEMQMAAFSLFGDGVGIGFKGTFVTAALTGDRVYTFPNAACTVVGITNTQTLTNKRITQRAVAVTDSTTFTPTGDTADVNTQANTQATGTLTVSAPTGAPTNCQSLILRIKSTNVQTFAWNAIYRGGTLALPATSTGGSKTDYFYFMYNSTDAKWDLQDVKLNY